MREKRQTGGRAFVVVLRNKKGDWASVVTDGDSTAMYTEHGRTLWASPWRALANLENRGYRVSMEECAY